MFELRCFAENGEQSKYLQRLDLSYMKVVTLPQELPGGLRELDLRGTHLLRLPKLPNSLQKLDLSGSLVSESDPPRPSQKQRRRWDRIAIFVASALSTLLVLQRTNSNCLQNITVPRVVATYRLRSRAL
jgi:Leucine-rich repeat (LRR) protein